MASLKSLTLLITATILLGTGGQDCCDAKEPNLQPLTMDSENGTMFSSLTSSRLQTLFPYYLTGFDDEGRPIWYSAQGRWDVRSFIGEDGTNTEKFATYLREMFDRLWESPKTYGKEIGEYIFLADLEGYDLRQFAHLQTLRTIIRLPLYLSQLESQERRMHKLIAVNVNYLFQTVARLIMPVIGSFASVIEMYGTNQDVWKPNLLRAIPKSQLPPSLGGFSNHSFVNAFG